MEPINADGDIQQTLFSLEELTVVNTNSISKLKNDLKNARDMLKSTFSESEDYTRQEGLVKEEKRQLDSIKQTLKKEQVVRNIEGKIEELKEELKEKQTAVSDYAMEYLRMSKKNSIERNGVKYDIVTTAKVVEHKST